MADRKLKIQPKHRPLATSYRDRIVPELRLCGVWLEQSDYFAKSDPPISVII